MNGTGTGCQLCHFSPSGGDGWNGYGWALWQEIVLNNQSIDQALATVEGLDSDADPSGSTNLVEIQADAQPGWTVGPNNTIYFSNGSTLPGQAAPGAILGDLDPGQIATPFCFGDGTGTPCPCSNEDGAGRGCANGTGVGALLAASGSASVSAGDLVLSTQGLVPNQPGLYFQGNNAIAGGLGTAFGDGLRCAGGGVVRLQVAFADGSGTSSTTVNIAQKGGVSAGQVRRYQVWYRDPQTSPCGSGFNLSNGLEVTWAP